VKIFVLTIQATSMKQQLYPALILNALKTVKYPGNGKDLVENEMVADDIRIDGDKVSFTLVFDRPTDPFVKSVVRAAETAILTFASEDADVKGNIAVSFRKPVVQEPENPLPLVKNIIGVSSGKGGVGKSTVASNLAVSLAAKGYKVGLLDADIFGPSVPKMFGEEEASVYIHEVDGKDKIIPVEKYGVKILSIGFLVDKKSPVLWRGGMASNALKQLITEADWGELDYFLIDMPPGTSDIHLTLVQTLPITGVVVVTTPQDVALADARKGIHMFLEPKINVPVLGLVENMAWFTPLPHPDERYYIFGNGGGGRLAEETGVELLGQIPLVADVCKGGDCGLPVSAPSELRENAEDISARPEVVEFKMLADRVVAATERRNQQLPATEKVHVGR